MLVKRRPCQTQHGRGDFLQASLRPRQRVEHFETGQRIQDLLHLGPFGGGRTALLLYHAFHHGPHHLPPPSEWSVKIAGQTFNAGFMNMSIMEIAQIAKRVVQEMFPEKGEIPIVTTPTDDIRSYHVNSDKIKRVLGFQPKRTVEDAIRDLCVAFKEGKLPNSMQDTFYFNVRRLKELKAA